MQKLSSTGSTAKTSKSSGFERSVGSGSAQKLDSKSSLEEGDVVDYDQDSLEAEESDEVKLLPKSGEYYYQDYKYVKPTQSDFDHKQVQDSKLFAKTKKIVPGSKDDIIREIEPFRDASILVSGFGMRNVDSFQRLIKMSHEERRRWELRKLWREEQAKEAIAREQERKEQAGSTARSGLSDMSTSTASSSDFLSQTETVSKTTDQFDRGKQLEYLLGLETEMEEQPEMEFEAVEEHVEDDFKYSTSKSIREAQRYLRQHRIFECFQFIIAHLLSANAKNPIEFILNLLNRCLLYRSGLGEPPLLYEKKHISQLFTLMDKLQMNFIDFEQYKMGMKTLGICSYNENPDIDAEDQISKETFIEEAYEAELAIFNEFIRRRPEKGKTTEKAVPSSFDSFSAASFNPPYFIPSDLLKFRKRVAELTHDYEEG